MTATATRRPNTDDLPIEDELTIDGDKKLVRFLENEIRVHLLELRNCPNLESLPKKMYARRIVIENCPKLTTLPSGLRCFEIRARNSNLETLPDDLAVEYKLDLSDSKRLRNLPKKLKVSSLDLSGCTALEKLPAEFDVCYLSLASCAQLTRWPSKVTIRCGHIDLSGCSGLKSLPRGLKQVGELNLNGCTNIHRLPSQLEVSSWMDVAESGIRSLPQRMKRTRLRWNGVYIDERVAFRPETLEANEILEERNAELRRVMIERVGFDWLVARANANELDADTDAGGERRLLRVEIPNDENLVVVSVHCPSTGHHYILRVPPGITTCRQASAWLAGFDNPDDYDPVVET